MEVDGSKFNSMETSMETSMEVSGSRFTSMQVSGSFREVKNNKSFYCRWNGSFHHFHQLQLPPQYCIPASMGFHKPLKNSIHIHEYHKLPPPSTRHTTTLTLVLTPSWHYLHGSWPSFKCHRSKWKYTWTYMGLNGCFYRSWNCLINWPSDFHGRWKRPWK